MNIRQTVLEICDPLTLRRTKNDDGLKAVGGNAIRHFAAKKSSQQRWESRSTVENNYFDGLCSFRRNAKRPIASPIAMRTVSVCTSVCLQPKWTVQKMWELERWKFARLWAMGPLSYESEMASLAAPSRLLIEFEIGGRGVFKVARFVQQPLNLYATCWWCGKANCRLFNLYPVWYQSFSVLYLEMSSKRDTRKN